MTVRHRRLGVAAGFVDGRMVPGDVAVAGDGTVAAVGLSPPGGRGLAAPGFVDLQVNGFAGVDLLGAAPGGDDERVAAWSRLGSALAGTGVTSYQPTLVSAPEPTLVAALPRLPRPAAACGARPLGVHLEGPFLAPERLGTHTPEHRRDPDPVLLDRLLDAAPHELPVTTVTMAPERPGALELVRRLVGRGVVCSLGHTDADAPTAHAAFDVGASTVTHLFNAMRPFTHRDPGVAGAALARADVTVQLIVDGHHLADEAVLLAWRAAAGRVALVTDATAAAAGGTGNDLQLGDVDLRVADGAVRRGDGTLAGSASTMIDAVRRVVGLGLPLHEALFAASATPARILGRDDVGRLAPGLPADVVVLDDRLELSAVLVGGAHHEPS